MCAFHILFPNCDNSEMMKTGCPPVQCSTLVWAGAPLVHYWALGTATPTLTTSAQGAALGAAGAARSGEVEEGSARPDINMISCHSG